MSTIAEHEGNTVAAVVHTVGAQQRVGRATHHDGVGRKMLELIAVDDRVAGIFRDYAHRRLATDVVAANDRAGTDQVHRAVGSIGEVVALDEYRNVAGHDAAAIAVEVVVANGDGAAAPGAPLAAHSP